MNFLAAVEKISDLIEMPNYFHKEKCIQWLSKRRDCSICVDHCPANATSINATLEIDHDKCVHCGLCLRLCPVGALVGDDGFSNIIRCFQFMESTDCVEFVCNQNPNAELGSDGNLPVLQVDRCLAAYGPSVYLFLHAIGVHRIILRLDACDNCKIGSVRKDILQAKEDAENIFLALESKQLNIEVIERISPTFHQRPVIQINNPPINRRGFLSLFSKQSINFLSKLLELSPESKKGGKYPSDERFRLTKLIKIMIKDATEGQQLEITKSLKIGSISISDRCSACGVCSDVCPTGALSYHVDDKGKFQIKFLPLNCVNCGICVDCCEMGAIKVIDSHTSNQSQSVLDIQNQALLRSGELRRCKRCHVQYSSANTSDLCPICEQRCAHPFGFVLPQNIR